MTAERPRNRIAELRRVQASSLVPHPGNWRTHPGLQRRAVQAAIDEVGIADVAICRQLEDGRLGIIDGHLRADLLGDQEIPVVVLDVDEDEAAKILATLDPLAGLAGADHEALAQLINGVDFQQKPLEDVVASLLAPPGHETTGPPPVEPDDGPPITTPGDLWRCGGHRIICGDAEDEETVARLFAGAEPDLMVTDPPYGVDYDPKWRNEAAEKGQLAYAARRTGEVSNDGRCSWAAAWRLFPGAVAYVWHADRHAPTVAEDLEAAGFEIRTDIIWSKPHLPVSRGHYHWRHEPCWYAVRRGAAARWAGPRGQSTLWSIALDKNVTGGHSTQKPVECMARPIRNHGREGDVVYDPFLGSGTTLIAAHQLERTCVALDIDPRYVDAALQRWVNLAQQSPIRESDGARFVDLKQQREAA